MAVNSHLRSSLKEISLWGLSTIIGAVIPASVVFGVLYYLLEMSIAKSSSGAMAACLLTLTWGSWGSLYWSEKLLTRLFERVTTCLPGSLLVGTSVLGLVYLRYTSVMGWIILGAFGLALVFASATLSGRVKCLSEPNPPLVRYGAGLIVVPVVTTVFSGLIGTIYYLAGTAAWSSLAVVFDSGYILDFLGTANMLKTLMAYALITTILPGGISLFVGRVLDRDAK